MEQSLEHYCLGVWLKPFSLVIAQVIWIFLSINSGVLIHVYWPCLHAEDFHYPTPDIFMYKYDWVLNWTLGSGMCTGASIWNSDWLLDATMFSSTRRWFIQKDLLDSTWPTCPWTQEEHPGQWHYKSSQTQTGLAVSLTAAINTGAIESISQSGHLPSPMSHWVTPPECLTARSIYVMCDFQAWIIWTVRKECTGSSDFIFYISSLCDPKLLSAMLV